MEELNLSTVEESNLPKKERWLLLLFAFLAGVSFNYLFYGKDLGISYPVFVSVFLGIFWWNTRKMLVVKKSFGWFILIPVFLLSATFAIYSNPVLWILNFLLIPPLVVTHTVLVTDQSQNWSVLPLIGNIFRRVIPQTFPNFPKPLLLVREELKLKESRTINIAGKKILIGLCISIPVLLLIIPLLTSADMMFGYYVRNLTRVQEFFDFKPIVNQVVIVVFVLHYIFSFFFSFYVKHPKTEGKQIFTKNIWDPTILVTVMFVIDLVYLIFSIIQFSYLYGGGRHSLPATFTYAEYARRGFFELVAVTIINLSIVLSCVKFVKKDNPTLYSLVRGALSLLVIFSLNMLFSAHFKMSLYEEAYGLTYLRIFVHYFMGLLFVLFLLAICKIWLEKIPLVKTYIVMILTFYVALNFINVDRVIAHNNIDRYFKTGQLDFYYLQNLSPDAIPEMLRLADSNDRQLVDQVNNHLAAKKQELLIKEPWQSFNYSKYKAKSSLLSVR